MLEDKLQVCMNSETVCLYCSYKIFTPLQRLRRWKFYMDKIYIWYFDQNDGVKNMNRKHAQTNVDLKMYSN